jgi:DUF177 domain-containing protein
MIVRVADLEDHGLRIDDVAAVGAPYSDPAWHLDRLNLAMELDGREVIVHGRIAATVPQTCGRCLEAFGAPVETDLDLRLAPRTASADSVELGQDDLDVDFYDGDQIDVGALIETETTLALPMKPLCRDDCRGLCPVCGGNRNVRACACAARPPDPRLAALRELAARLDH